MSAFVSNSGSIRALLDGELDHVAGGAGLVDQVLTDLENGVPGVLGPLENGINGAITVVETDAGKVPVIGGLLGQLI